MDTSSDATSSLRNSIAGWEPKVSVVIVNWNGAEHLEECLSSLAQQTLRQEMEVLVIDNNSSDRSLDLLSKYSPGVRVLRNDTNVGFAAGCNQGIVASKGEFVALLNNDTIVSANWLEELVSAMQRDDRIGCCSSKVLSYFDRTLIDNTGHVFFPDGLNFCRGRLQTDTGQFEQLDEVFSPSGCAALLRRSMLDDVGLLDEQFFAYGEDADLGFRARLRGWRSVYVPSAVIYHKLSASSSAYSPFKALMVERNRIWLAVKNLPLPLLLLSPLFTIQRYFWQCMAILSGSGASGNFVRQQSRTALVRILILAYVQAIRGLPSIISQRRTIQRRRVISTAEVWRILMHHRISARDISFFELSK